MTPTIHYVVTVYWPVYNLKLLSYVKRHKIRVLSMYIVNPTFHGSYGVIKSFLMFSFSRPRKS